MCPLKSDKSVSTQGPERPIPDQLGIATPGFRQGCGLCKARPTSALLLCLLELSTPSTGEPMEQVRQEGRTPPSHPIAVCAHTRMVARSERECTRSLQVWWLRSSRPLLALRFSPPLKGKTTGDSAQMSSLCAKQCITVQLLQPAPQDHPCTGPLTSPRHLAAPSPPFPLPDYLPPHSPGAAQSFSSGASCNFLTGLP